VRIACFLSTWAFGYFSYRREIVGRHARPLCHLLLQGFHRQLLRQQLRIGAPAAWRFLAAEACLLRWGFGQQIPDDLA